MRVALAEDSVLLREGLARLLGEAGFEVVAQCDNADDLLLKVRSYDPDVAIVDIVYPGRNNDEGSRRQWISAAASVGQRARSCPSTSSLGWRWLRRLRRRRLPRATDWRREEFAAVRRVAAGGSALDPLIVQTLVSRQRPDDPLVQLTPREREVLELMAEGSSNQGIADKLVITVRAVEKYVSSIFGKLGLPSTGSKSRRVLAVLTFLRS
jgi:DNA-binding NarL/FixJ family response regulator